MDDVNTVVPPATPPVDTPAPQPADVPAPPMDTPTPPTDTPPTGTPPTAHWSDALPAALKPHFAGMDEAGAAAAIKRGIDYKPATKAEDVALKLPEGLTEDPAMSASFKQFAVDTGMTGAQAQKAVDWFFTSQAKAQDAAIESGMTELKGRWGTNEKINFGKAEKAFVALNRLTEGRFGKSAEAKMLANMPGGVEMLYHVSELIGEDALGKAAPAHGEATAMSAREFYKTMFPKS